MQSLQSLERLERLESLESLQRLESLESLQRFNLDYQQVPIPEDAVIYCDIPYRGTDKYQTNGFDYERFYDWAATKRNIYISEYSIPDERFVVVAERKKRVTLSASSNSNVATERVYTVKEA